MTGRSVRSARWLSAPPLMRYRFCGTTRMIGLRQREPIDRLVAIVARVCPYCQSNLRPDGSIKLCHVLDISNDNIRAGHKVWHSRTDWHVAWAA